MNRKPILFWAALLPAISIFAAPIKLTCWIVREDNGASPHSAETVTNCVVELNKIFSQVAMEFSLESISWTNSSYLTSIVYTNSAQITALCSITNQTGGLEVYFVKSISHRANAFCGRSGIVVSGRYNRTTLAHEVGHACGLSDIYVTHRETNLSVTGMPCKAWLPRDWGWYPESLTQGKLIERLLMYGYDTSDKGDISRGDVYGLYYEHVWNAANNNWDKKWHLELSKVGFKDHGNRHPMSQ